MRIERQGRQQAVQVAQYTLKRQLAARHLRMWAVNSRLVGFVAVAASSLASTGQLGEVDFSRYSATTRLAATYRCIKRASDLVHEHEAGSRSCGQYLASVPKRCAGAPRVHFFCGFAASRSYLHDVAKHQVLPINKATQSAM